MLPTSFLMLYSINHSVIRNRLTLPSPFCLPWLLFLLFFVPPLTFLLFSSPLLFSSVLFSSLLFFFSSLLFTHHTTPSPLLLIQVFHSFIHSFTHSLRSRRIRPLGSYSSLITSSEHKLVQKQGLALFPSYSTLNRVHLPITVHTFVPLPSL